MTDSEKAMLAMAEALHGFGEAVATLTEQLAGLQSSMKAQSEQVQQALAAHRERVLTRARNIRALVGDVTDERS